ncbi:MAG TPA: DUF5671 domain-containing protein [Candidatus Limnocylindria bacterium]|nr:DUF5671 domain-containing protein [Candidatus Limnocylindria bacterium]
MQTARRLYVYLMTGIGLGVLIWGVTLLLTTLFEALGLEAEAISPGEQLARERLTLATALTAVALPVWLIHWWLAERSVRPERPDFDLERSSTVRGLFFAVVLGVLLVIGFNAASRIVDSLLLGVLGQSLTYRSPLAPPLALLLTAGTAWGYHVFVRLRDMARGPIADDAAWLPRLYLYLAALGSLLVLAFALTGLADLLRRLVFEQEQAGFGEADWWAFPLASSISGIAVGGIGWAAHWGFANRLRNDPGWRGVAERASRLRLAYFVAVLVIASAAVVVYLAGAATPLIQAALGVWESQNGAPAGHALVGVVNAAVFAAVWWLHLGWLHAENRAIERMPLAWRLAAYPMALVGLAFGAVSIGWLLGLTLDVLLGGGRTLSAGSVWERELAGFLPFALLGFALWIWQWARISARYASTPRLEAASAVRRTALLLVIGVTIVAGIISLGLILYRLFGTLFGVQLGGDIASELSTPLGALIVALAVIAYHVIALRRDQQWRETAGAAAAPPPLSGGVALALLGPSGVRTADVEAVLARLRAQLPEGYRLETGVPSTPTPLADPPGEAPGALGPADR